MDRDNEDRFERSGVGSRPVETRGDDVRVRRGGHDVGVREAHRRFGGVDVPAAIAGTLAALGMSVLLGGLLAAAGLLRYGDDAAATAGAQDETALATGAAVTALVIALLSIAFGAWVAGRMARYDGGRNGILTAVLYVLALAGLSAAGLGLGNEASDGGVGVRLGDLTESDAFGPLGIAGAIGAIALLLLTGWAFGRLGSRYHRKADEVIAGTRDGAIGRSASYTRDGGLDTDTYTTRTARTETTGGLRSDEGMRGVTGPGSVTGRARDFDDAQDISTQDRTRRGSSHDG